MIHSSFDKSNSSLDKTVLCTSRRDAPFPTLVLRRLHCDAAWRCLHISPDPSAKVECALEGRKSHRQERISVSRVFKRINFAKVISCILLPMSKPLGSELIIWPRLPTMWQPPCSHFGFVYFRNFLVSRNGSPFTSFCKQKVFVKNESKIHFFNQDLIGWHLSTNKQKKNHFYDSNFLRIVALRRKAAWTNPVR